MNENIYETKIFSLPKRILVLLGLLLILVVPRIIALDTFVVTDEPAWIYRSANFYYALGQRDFSQTFQKYHPGVPVMWIEAASFLINNPEYRGMGPGYFDSYHEFNDFIQTTDIDVHQILITSRLITSVLNLIILMLALAILSEFISLEILIIISLLIGFSPYYLGYSRLAHLDGIQSTSMFLSLVAYWSYSYTKRNKKLYIILSAIATAIAFLTRLPGILIMPILLGITLINYFNSKKLFNINTLKEKKSWWMQTVKILLLWIVVFLLACLIIWPALWVDFKVIFLQFMAPLNFVDSTQEAVITIKYSNPLGYYSRYLIAYLWGTTPITLLGLMIAGVAYIKRFGPFRKKINREIALVFFCAGIGFLAFMTIPAKSASRYILFSFMSMDVISAFGIVAVKDIISRNLDSKHQLFYSSFLLVISLVYIVGTMQTYPYYINYYNPLMGGSLKAGQSRFVGYGEGLDQAGRYLSQKPNAEDLTALSWYGFGSFSYFFPGQALHISTAQPWSEKFLSMMERSDYLVVYTNQWYRKIPPELFDILKTVEIEHAVWVGNIEYARIYKISDIPLVGITP